MVNEKETLELKCSVIDCNENPISLITVTDKSKEVAKYTPCQNHDRGIATAVQIKYAGYTITITDIVRG